MSNQPVRGQQYVFYVTLVSRSTGQFQVNPTIAAGDFQVSKDGGSYANLATLPAVEPAGSESVKVTLSASEMSAGNVNFRGKDVAGAEWDDVFSNIQPISWLTPSDIVNSNVVLWASGTVVTPNLTGIPKVDLVDIDGLATNGNNATLNLKRLVIENTDAGMSAVRFRSTNGGNTMEVVHSSSDGFEAALLLFSDGHPTNWALDIANADGVAVDIQGLTKGVHIAGGADYGVHIQAESGDKDGLLIEGVGTGKSINAPQGILGDIYGSVTGSVLRVLEPVGISTGSFINAIADQVWDEQIAGHLITGSTGGKLNAAGAAGDPWSTSLPGAYGAGTAGNIVGTNLNATVSSRSSHSVADIWAAVIETGYTAKQAVRLMLSALAGKLSGAATNTVTIRDVTDSKDRITATVDSDGNRTAVTHDVSD